MKFNLLRVIAAYWLGVKTDADIFVVRRWTGEDDVRAVTVRTVHEGETRQVTLYRHRPNTWSAFNY